MFNGHIGRVGASVWSAGPRTSAGLIASGLFVCLVMSAPSAGAQAAAHAQPAAQSKGIERLSEATRQAVVAETTQCRAEVQRQFAEQTSDQYKPEGKGYTSGHRARYVKMRSKTPADANAACARQVNRKYRLQPGELEALMGEPAPETK